jgi:class 3 adenylate cyclase
LEADYSSNEGINVTTERVERRLAAVLAADVAGYSRLIGVDEEGTLARLRAVRKALVDPTIASHRGRIVKTTGDGMSRRVEGKDNRLASDPASWN